MHHETYELEFERFLESADLDAAEDALFSALRAAFDAGWRAGRRRFGVPSPFRKSSRERAKKLGARLDTPPFGFRAVLRSGFAAITFYLRFNLFQAENKYSVSG